MASILIVEDDRLMRGLLGDVTQPLGDDENRAGSGGAFCFTRPIEAAPPKIQAPDA